MTADAVREALENIKSEIGMRGDLAYGWRDIEVIEARLAALAGAAPVAWQYERYCLCVGGWHDWVTVVSTASPADDGLIRNITPLFPHAPAKAREVTEEWLDGIVRNAVYRHFDTRGQVITGKNTIVMNVVSDVSAALATFAEGKS